MGRTRTKGALPPLALLLLLLLATGTTHGVTWCDNTNAVTLTTCGSECSSEEPCAQYPEGTTCSNASGNTCETYSSSCTYQCLDAYNTAKLKWTLFVKNPVSTDSLSAAPVTYVTADSFAEEATAM